VAFATNPSFKPSASATAVCVRRRAASAYDVATNAKSSAAPATASTMKSGSIIRCLRSNERGALGLGPDLGDADAVIAVDDDDLAPGERPSVDEELDGLVDAAIE